MDMRASGRLLGLYELAGLLHDDLSVGDLRRIREGGLELLLAHPVGRDAGRLLRVCRGVKEADGADDAVAGLDQVIAAESRQLTQSGKEGVLSLLDELVGAVLVDRFVASDGSEHCWCSQLSSSGRTTRLSHPLAPRIQGGVERSLQAPTTSAGGFWRRTYCSIFVDDMQTRCHVYLRYQRN